MRRVRVLCSGVAVGSNNGKTRKSPECKATLRRSAAVQDHGRYQEIRCVSEGRKRSEASGVGALKIDPWNETQECRLEIERPASKRREIVNGWVLQCVMCMREIEERKSKCREMEE